MLFRSSVNTNPNNAILQFLNVKPYIKLIVDILAPEDFAAYQANLSSSLEADKYTYLHWANSSQIKLDTNYHNILILESVERTAREHFSEKVDNYQIIGHDTIAEVQAPQLSWKRRLFQKS